MDWGICKYLERGKEGNPIKLEKSGSSLSPYVLNCMTSLRLLIYIDKLPVGKLIA